METSQKLTSFFEIMGHLKLEDPQKKPEYEPPPPANPHDNLIERFVLGGYNVDRVSNMTLRNQVVRGLVHVLNVFHDCPRAESLCFHEVKDNQTKEKMEQAKSVIEVLKDIKCPFTIEPHHIIRMEYDVLTKVVLWVLRQALILEFDENQEKKYFANYFYKKFSNEDIAFDEFRKRFTEESKDITKNVYHYKMFKEEILQKKLTGQQILGKYMVTKLMCNFLDINDSDSNETATSEDIKKRQSLVPTAEEIFENEGNVVAAYREGLSSTIESLFVDVEFDKLEKRINDEAKAYIKTRQEFRFIEDHLFTTYSRTENFEQYMMDEVAKEMQNMINRAKIFTDVIKEDFNTLTNIQNQLELKMQSDGEEFKNESNSWLFNLHKNAASKFGEILASCNSLVSRLDEMTIETSLSDEQVEMVNQLKDSPDLCSNEYFVPIDDRIVDDIVALSSRISSVVQVILSIPLPNDFAAPSMAYQSFFMSYVEDVLTKLTDWYWKVDALHYNRVEDKNRIDLRRGEMRAKQRTEVKQTLIAGKLFKLNQIIQSTAHEINELHKSAEIVQLNVKSELERVTGKNVPLTAIQRHFVLKPLF